MDEDAFFKSQMEKMVPSYDAYMRKVTLGREHLLREATVALAQIKPGESVLEVGCGTGTLALEAKRQVGSMGEVCGIDILPGMIERSRQKADLANEQIAFEVGGIDAISYPANYFDAVLCSFMIFHMSETTRRKGAQEVYRVLKPQGRWLIVDFAKPSQPLQNFFAKTFFSGMMEQDLRELIPMMDSAGFTSLEIAPVNFRIIGLSIVSYARGVAQKK